MQTTLFVSVTNQKRVSTQLCSVDHEPEDNNQRVN